MDPDIERWLTNINAADTTRRMFGKAVMDFCQYIEKTPREVLNEYTQDIKDAKLMPERAVFNDIPMYLRYLKTEKPNNLKRNGDDKKGLSPKSINLYKAALKSFFDNNYIEFPRLKKGDRVYLLYLKKD